MKSPLTDAFFWSIQLLKNPVIQLIMLWNRNILTSEQMLTENVGIFSLIKDFRDCKWLKGYLNCYQLTLIVFIGYFTADTAR